MSDDDRTDEPVKPKSLRARRYGQQDQPELPEPEPAPLARAEESVTGPKLTEAQRETLYVLIHVYADTPTVMDMWRSEYPDYPTITEALVRYYRKRAGQAPAMQRKMQERLQAVVTEGLALKERRIAHLERQYKRLTGIQRARDDRARADGRTPSPDLEIVKQQQAILRQIGEELGQMSAPNQTTIQNNVIAATANLNAAPDTADLDEQLDRLLEQRRAMDEALQGIPELPALEEPDEL